ncbi:MAG: polyprenyl synthetase family protein [Thermoplasmatota archaeon]
MDALTRALSPWREKIDGAIAAAVAGEEPARLYHAVRHLPEAGGKRLRPLIAMLACDAVGGDPEGAVQYGAALELLHTFTLVHDDIMDDDDMRRGQRSVHREYGKATAILAGDTLFAMAFETATAEQLPAEVERRLAHNIAVMAREICEGQQLDMGFEERADIDEELFLTMIEKKTAKLFEHAALGGAIIGGGSPAEQDALRRYGHALGMAFQIWDDCLDVIGVDIGKPVGSDIREGKKTLMYIHAREHADDEAWLQRYGDHRASREDIEGIVEMFRNCGAVDHATETAKRYAGEATRCLDVLPESDARQHLAELAMFAVSRGM